MKKIISLLASVAIIMSVSATAFAKIPADATAPKAAVTITEVAPLSGGYATYQLTLDLSDLGTVTHTPVKVGPTTKYSGDKIVQFDFNVEGADLFYNADISGAISTAGWTGTGDSSEFTGIYVSYANVDVLTNFPLTETANACKGAIQFTFFGVPGNTITLNKGNMGYFTYEKGVGSGMVQYLPVTFDKTTFTLGGDVVKPTLDVTATLDGKYTDGYVWTANLTKGAGAVNKFTADFTAAEGSVTKEIKNVAELAGKFTGEGKLSFNIGLNTKKTLTGATFTVGDDAAATKSFAAPISK